MLPRPDGDRRFGPELTILRDGAEMPESLAGAVAAIGNFDGVHLGHKWLMGEAIRRAGDAGGPAAVVTFEPHPREFFRPDVPGFRLTSTPDKLAILRRMGLDLVVIIPFDGVLASTSARDFVHDTLARKLRLSGVIVGENFRFGRGREGDGAALSRLAAATGLTAVIAPAVTLDGAPVSSSRVRDHLEAGDVGEANRVLGHRWFVSGPVIHGAKRGRELGYPTANLELARGCRLAHGIYAVRAEIGPGDVRAGVASFGSRPTFDDGPPLLETFLFDFSGDLYDRVVRVELLGRIRAEERFNSVAALKVRMDADVVDAKAVLARAGPLPPSMLG